MNGDQDKRLGNERVEVLKKLFREMDANKDENLSFEEFHQYLSKKCGKDFNQELLTEIFRTIDRDKNSMLNLDEFIQGYSKAELIIQGQISTIKGQISENSEKSTNAQRNLLEAKAKKLQNIAENNLFITIKRAEGLRAGGVTGNKAPIVCITCETNEIQTLPVPNPTNPEWNQSFSFPILQGVGDILIEVYDTDRGKKTNFLGEVAIPLRALINQELHEDFLELRGRTNLDRVQGKILISLRWVHDLPLYLEALIKEYEDQLVEDKLELKSLEEYAKELQSPIKANSMPEWISKSEHFVKVEQLVASKVNTIFEKTLGNRFKWPVFTTISIYVFMLLSVLSTFCRPDFMNVITKQLTLSLTSLLFYFRQQDIAVNFRLVTVGVIISQFYDVIWLWNYFSVSFT